MRNTCAPSEYGSALRRYYPIKDIVLLIKKNKKVCAVALVALVALVLVCSYGGAKEKNTSTLAEYKEKLEKDLSDYCSSIDGVGKCYVRITFERGEENVYRSGQLTESLPPKVLGVSVICKGADSDYVKRELTELFTSLFGIGTNRVKILKLK